MNTMNTPTFLITQYLDSSMLIPDLIKHLYKLHGILAKHYEKDNLLLLYHPHDITNTTELERECRSLVVDSLTLKILSYSCETPLMNNDGMNYILNNPENQIHNICYEGTYLSVFFHNNKWYVSTRRCLNSQESVFTNSESISYKSHFDMFEDILKLEGYESFNNFCEILNPSQSYYFVLIHHQNKHIIDYTKIFGIDYSRLCLTSVRDVDMREIDIYETPINFASYNEVYSKYIFVPVKLDISSSLTLNNTLSYDDVLHEGIIIRIWNPQMYKYHLIKLQNINFQFEKAKGVNSNIYKGLLYLYQTNKLIEYFNLLPTPPLKTLVNPNKPSEIYDIVGVIDTVFKSCTSELFELFKLLWSLNTGNHQNKPLYEILPNEYKTILFGIRGIFYKKKALLHTYNKETVTSIQIKKTHLKISDIYNYLKTLPTETIISLLRMRAIMQNRYKMNITNTQLSEFNTISNQCDKFQIKLYTLYINKLFPDLTSTDIQ
jgi:hypothetical protein